MNFEEKMKTTYKQVTENSDASSTNLKSELKKMNSNAVETSWKNLKVSGKSWTQSTSDSAPGPVLSVEYGKPLPFLTCEICCC